MPIKKKTSNHESLKNKTQTKISSEVKNELKKAVLKAEVDSPSDFIPETALEVIDAPIGERQPMKQAFIAEHLFRKTIEDAIPCGIAAFDNLGRQIYVNRTFCDMLGWNEKELMGGKYPYVYWDRRDTGQLSSEYRQLRKGKVPPNGVELPFLKKDGDKLWGWVLGRTIYENDGTPAGQLIALMDITQKKQAEDTLRRLSTQLVGAQERQRKLVSQDLHDSIGGRLAGIKYAVEKIIKIVPQSIERVSEALNDLLGVVKTTIEETQRISKNLHPSILDDLGLKAALKDLVQEFQTFYPGIRVNCHLKLDDHQLSEYLKILVFRVCQEALTNIGKHSQADRAVIVLDLLKGYVVLTIEDNGRGIETEMGQNNSQVVRHDGLQNMRERTDLAGGRLEIQSRKGKGLKIRASWPNWKF